MKYASLPFDYYGLFHRGVVLVHYTERRGMDEGYLGIYNNESRLNLAEKIILQTFSVTHYHPLHHPFALFLATAFSK